MITIISGTPGSGKTSLVVDLIMDQLKTGRKVYTYGIPDLLLNVSKSGDPCCWHDGSWLQIDAYDPKTCEANGLDSSWYPRGIPEGMHVKEYLKTRKTPPDAGALIIIDEAHIKFPQRASGKVPPPFIEALNVHRHQGLDFWFLTQKPSFLDPFVRGLCSQHIHLSLNAFSFTGARVKYVWAEYQETVNRTSKMLASRSAYKPPSHVFPLYASATLHTKLDQSMPSILKAFIVVLLLFFIMVGFAVSRVSARKQQIEDSQLVSSQPIKKAVGEGGETAGRTPTAAVNVESLKPKPDSLISSCIASATKCKCFTDRGLLVVLSDYECRANANSITSLYRLDPAPSSLPDRFNASPAVL